MSRLSLTTALAMFAIFCASVSGEAVQLKGRIRDQLSREPLKDVQVRLLERDLSRTTDATGMFVLPDLPPGQYVLHVTRTGYFPSTVPISVSPTDTLIPDIALQRWQFTLDPLVVTATRHARPSDHIAGNISVIDAAEIQAMPAHNIAEILNFTTGLNIQRNGGLGTSALPSIQGSHHRHVRVLLDGIEVNTLAEGLGSLTQLGAENIDRIEIVKGPASSTWGSSLGGVIQILTRSPDGKGPYMEAGSSLGRWNTQRHVLTLNKSVGPFNGLLSSSRTTTDGFRPRSAHEVDRVLLKTNTRPTQKSLMTLWYGYSGGETEDFEDLRRGTWRLRRHKLHYGGLRFESEHNDRLGMAASVTGIEQTNWLHISQIGDAEQGSLKSDEGSAGLTLKATAWPYRDNIAVSGVELRRAAIDFSVIGGETDQHVTQGAVFLTTQQDLEAFTFTAGCRYDHNTAYGSQWSPNLGGVWRFGKNHLVRAAVTRGFGAPPLTYRYMPETDTRAPNPSIKAERAWSYQIGFEGRTWPYLWEKVSLYRSNITDAIRPALNDEGKQFQKNFAEERRQGIEVELGLEFPSGLSVSVGMGIHENTDLDQDEPIRDIPELTYDIGVRYVSTSGFRGSLLGHYVDYDVDPVYPAMGFTTRDRRFVWDAKFAHDISVSSRKLSVFLLVYNLFDVDFWWITPFPLPERWLEVGIQGAF